MKKFTPRETLKYIIETLLENLDELSATDNVYDEFIYGERTAYIECLELVQHWDEAAENGLDFNIEDRFPL